MFGDINMDSTEYARRKREMSHWNIVAKALYGSRTEQEVLEMLYVELRGYRRAYIIRRIHAHYNAIRRKRELEEISKFIKKSMVESQENLDETVDN